MVCLQATSDERQITSGTVSKRVTWVGKRAGEARNRHDEHQDAHERCLFCWPKGSRRQLYIRSRGLRSLQQCAIGSGCG